MDLIIIKKFPLNETHESPLVMLVPLIFLGIGAIFSGYLFKNTFIGHHSNEFWQDINIFLNEIKHEYTTMVFINYTYFSFNINTNFILFLYFKTKSF